MERFNHHEIFYCHGLMGSIGPKKYLEAYGEVPDKWHPNIKKYFENTYGFKFFQKVQNPDFN